MLKRLFLFLFSVLVSIVIVPHAAEAQTAPASNPPGLCKAGLAVFAAGQAGIFVNFPAPWPANVTYRVTVQQTNTSGYSPTTACTYFNVLKKTSTQFQVQHKLCDTGVPVPLAVNVSMDWIACPDQ
jgi:hypothetical protein